MIFEPFYQPGRRWSLLPHLPKSPLLKLKLMFLLNIWPCRPMPLIWTLQVYERPLAVTPFGAPEAVPDWQDTHAMHAFLGESCLGPWIRTDLGVRTFQGLGKNGPTREQVVRRITKDLHTHSVLEDLLCDSHLQVPLHRKCLPDCGPAMTHTRDILTTFVYRLSPRFHGPDVLPLDLQSSRFPSGGGVRLLFKICFLFHACEDTSARSTLGSRTL